MKKCDSVYPALVLLGVAREAQRLHQADPELVRVLEVLHLHEAGIIPLWSIL